MIERALNSSKVLHQSTSTDGKVNFGDLPRAQQDFYRSSDGISLLEEQFQKEVKFESNVSLEITFQRLHVDEDWGEIYIDLDGE